MKAIGASSQRASFIDPVEFDLQLSDLAEKFLRLSMLNDGLRPTILREQACGLVLDLLLPLPDLYGASFPAETTPLLASRVPACAGWENQASKGLLTVSSHDP